jgi:hypothetical protein
VGLLTSFLTLIVAETVGVKAGLGWYLQWQKGYAEYGKVKKTYLQVGVRGNEGVEVMRKMAAGDGKWQHFTGTEAVVVSNPGTLLDGRVVEIKSGQGKADVKSARAP